MIRESRVKLARSRPHVAEVASSSFEPRRGQAGDLSIPMGPAAAFLTACPWYSYLDIFPLDFCCDCISMDDIFAGERTERLDDGLARRDG